jgi:hypothetical protein
MILCGDDTSLPTYRISRGRETPGTAGMRGMREDPQPVDASANVSDLRRDPVL